MTTTYPKMFSAEYERVGLDLEDARLAIGAAVWDLIAFTPKEDGTDLVDASLMWALRETPAYKAAREAMDRNDARRPAWSDTTLVAVAVAIHDVVSNEL